LCDWCMKHGAGGKWYLNAKNYSNEVARELNLEQYLTDQWKMFETVFIRKIMGTSSIGLGYKLKMPIVGRVIRWSAEKMIHSESPNRNPLQSRRALRTSSPS